MNPDVLVVGAGPTGLVLALWLTRMGVRVRIVDKSPHAGTTSRAVGVHARTLELYEQADLTGALLADGVRAEHAQIWTRGTVAGTVDLAAGAELSRYPFMLVYPQDKHEALLESRLVAAGVTVERNCEVTELGATTATLSTGERVEFRFVAGCDGAHSIVRKALGVEFSGGTYAHTFYVADVDAHGPPMNGAINICFDDADFLASFPLEGTTRARLIGEVENDGKDLTWDDISPRILERLQLAVDHVHWFSTYRVHHRVADTFSVHNAFLLGDAAHVHSPVGGQGMNTGIGDAINLAWKLAAVCGGKTDEAILASYAEERRPFAEKLVATTDKVFELVASEGKLASVVRNDILPHLVPKLMHFETARELFFKTLSQIEIEYRGSALSAGHAGRVHGGDRLPWVRTQDNFKSLGTWQVHTYGMARDVSDACRELGIAHLTFALDEAARAAHLGDAALYLVRPDGYLALVAKEPQELVTYFDSRRIRT